MNTFFSSLNYSEELVFAFGSGAAIFIFSILIKRFSKMIAYGLLVLSLSSIGMGSTRVLAEKNIIEHDSLLRLSPAVGVFIFFHLFYVGSLRLTEGNNELRKRLHVGYFSTLFFSILLMTVLVFAHLN
ncbi:hypothetical protein ACFO9Q_09795 [Paenibacillus sp. GCM10023252]|uniref:hypothetical protein n=1 Tax=Paenibacillus sp. GCM10023252 TaxID=3252649 RepID=UPI00361DA80E